MFRSGILNIYFQVHKILDDKQRVEFVSCYVKPITFRANPYFKIIYELLGTFISHAPNSAYIITGLTQGCIKLKTLLIELSEY